ncbi:unnamed protein product [Discula destructiva]
MAVKQPSEKDSVLVRLSVVRPGNIDYPERRLLLTESDPIITLGRSSSRPALNLQPAVTNGWYNSPVMSRNHAQLEADFNNETVGIRDYGSMHGTFLNNKKISSDAPTGIRPGDELILGMPVFRHQEEYQPALLRVDGFEFQEANSTSVSHSSTRPTNTFAVPEDCDDFSGDENEAMDEIYDDCTVFFPAAHTASSTVMQEPRAMRALEDPSLPSPHTSTPGPIPRIDGASDLVFEPEGAVSHLDKSFSSPSSPSEREDIAAPDAVAFIGNESEVMMNSACDSDGDIGSDIDADFESDRPPSDFEDEVMGSDDGSDGSGLSGLSGLSGNGDSDVSESSPFDDDDFEAEFLDDADQPDTDFDSEEEQLQDGPWAPTETAANQPWDGSGLVQLPPVRDIIPRSSWVSRSHSPSDFVFQSSRRAAAAPADKTVDMLNVDVGANLATPRGQAPVRCEDHEQKTKGAHPVSLGNSISRIAIVAEAVPSVATASENNYRPALVAESSDKFADLAQKSGKPEFFEAWAVNKKVICQKTQVEPAFAAEIVTNAEVCEGEKDAAIRDIHHTVGVPSAGSELSNSRQVEDLDSNEDASGLISSVYEWQGLRQSNWFLDKPRRCVAPQTGVPHGSIEAMTPGFTCATATEERVSEASSVEPTNKHVDTKGKRKAAAISDVGAEEVRWFSVAESKQVAPSVFPTTLQPNDGNTLLPSPPTSPDGVARREDRPTKKIKKIAEAVGYAALGGFSVGAAVLGSLIYTAPNFV